MLVSTLIVSGLVIIGTGCIGVGFFLAYSPQIYNLIDEQIVTRTRLEVGTEQYERWEEPPSPLIFKVFVFNVTNPDDIVRHGAKPVVREIGPFVYDEYFHKENIHYAKSDDTFRYNQYVNMEFIREESAFGENQKVTVLNLPLQSLFQSEEEGLLPPELAVDGMNLVWPKAFGGDGMFVTLSVKDFFFKGYTFCKEEEKEEENIHYFSNGEKVNFLKIFCAQVKTVGSKSPNLIINDEGIKFSMFSHKHNSTGRPLQVSAGQRDINTLGQLKSWNSDKYLELWEKPHSQCNQVRGTDSFIYAPFNNFSSFFYTYITDICRPMVLKTVGGMQFKGILGTKATMGVDNLINDGNNSCYCIRKTRDIDGAQNCLPDGFCDMKNCLKAPIIISFPHMLWANERYRATVEGLNPNEDEHISFLGIEPRTGTPLQGRKRIQFNMIIRPIDEIEVTQNLTPAMVPILWMEESFDLPDDMAEKLKIEFFNKLFLIDIATFGLIGTGLTCFAIGTGVLFFRPA